MSGKPAEAASRRNHTIDVLRFVFSVVVVLFHATNAFAGAGEYYPVHFALCVHGNAVVEFFFLVSGYLMAASAFRRGRAADERSLAVQTQGFVVGKVRGFFALHAVAFVGALVAHALVKQYGLWDLLTYTVQSVPSFFFLQMFGFANGPNSVEWYISAMLIAMAVLYPLLRRHYNMCVRVVFPLLACVLLGWLYHGSGRLTGVLGWEGIAFRSVFRAFAELALGAVLFEMVRWLDTRELTQPQRRVLTSVQVVALCCALACVCLTLPGLCEFAILGLLAIVVALSFSRQSLLESKLNATVADALGKVSLPVYLSQATAISLMQLPGDSLGGWPKVWLSLALTFVVGAVYARISNAIASR